MEGSKMIVRAEFRVPNDAGVLTDPTTVTYTARKKGGTPTAYVYLTATEVTRVSVGIFEFTYTPAKGTWHVHVQGTGTAHAAGEVDFVIRDSEALA